MPKLTQALVETMPVNSRDYFTFDTSLPGFAIRVTPIGTKLFVMQARVAGRKQRVTIGRYPDLTVVQARELALQALADMRGASTQWSSARRASGLRPPAK
jgi:hypothetical protein